MKTIIVTMCFENTNDATGRLSCMTADPRYAAHLLRSVLRESTTDEQEDFAERTAFCVLLDGWWCPNCECDINPEKVTYNERHDIRSGGCGCPVLKKNGIK